MRAGVVLFSLFLSSELVQAQALMCPATSVRSATTPLGTPRKIADYTRLPIELQADSWEATVSGEITLQGKVDATQGDRTVHADTVFYNTQTREIKAQGTVSYDDPLVLLSGTDASLNADGGALIQDASFLLKDSAGRGQAKHIAVSARGDLALDEVSYTSCPPEMVGWQLKLSDLNINQATQTGTGRNVRLLFGGVPIFYSPWLSFPVGNQRKSGFLFPILGSSSRGGQSLALPWYWNLATNYDDTITPSIDSARGVKLDNEFRYLGAHSRGQLLAGYLPRDNLTNDWRGYAGLTYRNDLTKQWRIDLDGQTVRDTSWFEDFGQGRDVTSLVYLNRQARLSFYTDHWYTTLNLTQLQTLDSTIARSDRPYSKLPSLAVVGDQPLPLGSVLTLDSELSYFTRADIDAQTPSVNAARIYLAPTLDLPLRGRGMYLTPSVGWRYSGYALKNTAAGVENNPSLSAPVYSLDTGMVFERLSSTRLYTLEPRLLYSYIPYRDQSALKDIAFDTVMPTFDQVQMFETNRFIGPDRLGDANQLSAGVTTRMLSAQDGTEYLSGTLGQVYYFTTPCITSLTQLACDSTTTSQHSSDVFGQMSLASYRHLSVSLGAQWSPVTQRSDQRNLSLQYRRDGSHIVNLVYRFARDTVEQWEASAAWPLTQSISGYGRVVYSQFDRKFLDHFAGLEYRSCCWNIRAVIGRTVTTRTGEYDTQFKLQLELKGLSSVGTADAFLQSSIPGYSARESQ